MPATAPTAPPAATSRRREASSGTTSPVHVRVVDASLEDAVRALRVAPAQRASVGDVAFNLADARRVPGSEAMAILAGDAVIGFYRLDHVAAVVAPQRLGPGTVGLRAFLLDAAWQGRGFAVPALRACCADLARRWPAATLLALNVDCANLVALAAYRRAGFVDTGALLAGGAGGPQRLMLRRLGAAGVGESGHG